MLTSEMYFYSRLVFTVIIGCLELTYQECPRGEEGVERRESTSEIELSRMNLSGVSWTEADQDFLIRRRYQFTR
jgi:hypothetical protein